MAKGKRRQKKVGSIEAAVSLSMVTTQPPAWLVVGAAVQGVSHRRAGLPCQDAQGYRLLPDGTLLIALSDGAGSARFSDQGAQRAVESGLNALSRLLEGGQPEGAAAWGDLLREAVIEAREAVLRLPQASSEQEDDEASPARAYACTLTLVAASSERLVAGQIGDGAVVASRPEGGLFAVTHLQRGEYANETHFLTQDDALDRLIVDCIEQPVRDLAVMSDGLIRLALKMPGQEPHAPFFAPLFRFASTIHRDPNAAEQLASFLDSERVNARTDDDKSLVLAVRTEQPELLTNEQPTLNRENQ